MKLILEFLFVKAWEFLGRENPEDSGSMSTLVLCQ